MERITNGGEKMATQLTADCSSASLLLCGTREDRPGLHCENWKTLDQVHV